MWAHNNYLLVLCSYMIFDATRQDVINYLSVMTQQKRILCVVEMLTTLEFSCN